MKLIDNWHKILLQSYAMWLVYLAGCLDIIPYIVPYLDDVIPKWASIVLLILSPLARIIPQESLSNKKELSNDTKS